MDNKHQILFNSTIMVRSYFGLFRDIALMYIASTATLSEGFDLIGQLSLDVNPLAPGEPSVIEAKRKRLLAWTTTATEEIKDIIKTVSCQLSVRNKRY